MDQFLGPPAYEGMDLASIFREEYEKRPTMFVIDSISHVVHILYVYWSGTKRGNDFNDVYIAIREFMRKGGEIKPLFDLFPEKMLKECETKFRKERNSEGKMVDKDPEWVKKNAAQLRWHIEILRELTSGTKLPYDSITLPDDIK